MHYEVAVLDQAREFLTNLETKLWAKAYRAINLLEQFGPLLKLPHSRKIVGTEELYELRAKQGTNICRLFYFWYNDEKYVVLSGFVKKQDKTDPKEIGRALNIMRTYVEEKNAENKGI
jgi:phage-related protein